MTKGTITTRLRILTTACFALFWLALPGVCFAQQGGTTRYVYDDNSRLRAVITPSGEAAVYEYDPAGNFTAIRRIAADTLEVIDFSPRSGVPGDKVTIIGTGFTGTGTTVAFNGVAATNIQVNVPVIIAEVPQGAATGQITVSNSRGTKTTSQVFTVQGARIMPAVATVVSGQSIQFTVDVTMGGGQGVKWSVSGIDGGNTSVGVISDTGNYTAPRLPFSVQSTAFFVRATSLGDPKLYGEARVTVKNSEFIRETFAAAVSVRRGYPSTMPIASAVSVRVGTLPNNSTISSAAVSVRRGYPATAPITSAVSILKGSASSPISIFSPGISILRGSTQTATPIYSPNVSLSKGPIVTQVTPTSIKRGETVTITIIGTNLTGASALVFLDVNGAVDFNVTIANISVNGTGTSLTANVTFSTFVSVGKRIAVVLALTGSSLATEATSNTIEVIQ